MFIKRVWNNGRSVGRCSTKPPGRLCQKTKESAPKSQSVMRRYDDAWLIISPFDFAHRMLHDVINRPEPPPLVTLGTISMVPVPDSGRFAD